jgi:hypothetical protein
MQHQPTSGDEDPSLDQLLSSLDPTCATLSLVIGLRVYSPPFLSSDPKNRFDFVTELHKAENAAAILDMQNKWKGTQPGRIEWKEVEVAYRVGVLELLQALYQCDDIVKWNRRSSKYDLSVWVREPEGEDWKIVKASTATQIWTQKTGLHELLKQKKEELKAYTIYVWAQEVNGTWRLCTKFEETWPFTSSIAQKGSLLPVPTAYNT